MKAEERKEMIIVIGFDCKVDLRVTSLWNYDLTRRTNYNNLRVSNIRVSNRTLVYIHSFITEIYIAPLQGYYSEALPTLARLKRRVLRLE